MKKVLGVFLTLIALIIAGAIALLMAPPSSGETSQNPVAALASNAKNATANAVIDASGIKAKAQDYLESNRDAIAAATGLTAAQIDEATANLNIEDWQAATLPSSASATGTINGSYSGVDGTLTTYDDPGYVTVEAYGQNITLAVPESAQQYVSLLGALQ